MRIPPWRLALTGGAIVVLAVAAVSLVAASSSPAAAPLAPLAAAPSTAPGVANRAAALPNRIAAALKLRAFGKHLVHATVTVTDRDGRLVTMQLDHGTVASIGSGSLAISEAGGGSVTVSTDSNTIVRLGGGTGKGSLADLKVGDEVFVQSRVDGGSTLAKHVLRVPAP